MSTMEVNIKEDIHAEIAGGDTLMLTNTSIIIDPLSKSHSSSVITEYLLEVQNVVGLYDTQLLHNGKNSRFSTSGVGSCDIKLTIKDDVGRTATDLVTITVE